MEFSAYQRAASETNRLRLGGPQGVIAPMLGLASETGSILNIYKKYLRDGIDLAANREFVREELGDLLWYTAAVATACGLDLEDIAQANLLRARDRYPRQRTEAECANLAGVSTDSARGPETMGNNRHQPGNPDTGTGRPTRAPGGPFHARLTREIAGQ
jgi:NTP pyrophosphatase (non-canonical NTP hydrolase)